MDKVQRIREEVERLKSQLLRGACSSQIAMETMCKEEAYNEVLAILDTMQEEPKQCMYSKDNYTEEDRKVLCEGCEEKCKFNQVKESAILQHKEKTCKENGDSLTQEPVSEVWHDAQTEQPQAKEKILATNEYGDCEVDFAINMALYWPKVIKWAYIEDLLNLSNVEQTAKNCKEPVSEDLGEYINELSKQFPDVSFAKLSRIAVRVAKWQKENLWKPADGDDLPEIDKEVIALLYNGRVVFAHRPPEFWDGKDIVTGKVTRYYPKTYGKGGWNIPNVKYWLDCLMPKEIEL